MKIILEAENGSKAGSVFVFCLSTIKIFIWMDIEGQSERKAEKYREQAKMIWRLDCTNSENRQFLTNSFRKLDKLVNKNRSFTLPKSNDDLIDTIINYAKNISPYSKEVWFERGPIISKGYYDQYVAYRRCHRAKVIIDGQIIMENLNTDLNNFSLELFKTRQFNLTIESEPNSTIVYTTNGEHPLLADDRHIQLQREVTTLYPPKTINIIVVSTDSRIESHLTTIVVRENRNGEQPTSSQGLANKGIVRPEKNHILDDSNEISESFRNIDHSSFLDQKLDQK